MLRTFKETDPGLLVYRNGYTEFQAPGFSRVLLTHEIWPSLEWRKVQIYHSSQT